MILRRLTKHVQDQNWFAVALDFVIVVFGVFIGIQLGNWNEARANNVRSQQYMQRMVVDLTHELSIYDDRIAFWRQVSDNGLTVLDEASSDVKSLDAWNLLLAYFQASQVAEFFATNATFEELKSAGELDLIRDAGLRSELAEYYAYPGHEGLRERPPYREHVRGIIPARVQIYIWSNCYMTNGASQQLKACPSPLEPSEAQSIVDQLQSNQALHEELTYWISALEAAGLIVQGNTQFASELRDRLSLQLGLEDETKQ